MRCNDLCLTWRWNRRTRSAPRLLDMRHALLRLVQVPRCWLPRTTRRLIASLLWGAITLIMIFMPNVQPLAKTSACAILIYSLPGRLLRAAPGLGFPQPRHNSIISTRIRFLKKQTNIRPMLLLGTRSILTTPTVSEHSGKYVVPLGELWVFRESPGTHQP